MASKSSGNILLRSWTIIILDTLRNVPIRKFKSEGPEQSWRSTNFVHKSPLRPVPDIQQVTAIHGERTKQPQERNRTRDSNRFGQMKLLMSS